MKNKIIKILSVAALIAVVGPTLLYAQSVVPVGLQRNPSAGTIYFPFLTDKVGVGTTSPFATLSVASSTGAQTTFSAIGGNAGLNATGTDIYIQSGDNGNASDCNDTGACKRAGRITFGIGSTGDVDSAYSGLVIFRDRSARFTNDQTPLIFFASSTVDVSNDVPIQVLTSNPIIPRINSDGSMLMHKISANGVTGSFDSEGSVITGSRRIGDECQNANCRAMVSTIEYNSSLTSSGKVNAISARAEIDTGITGSLTGTGAFDGLIALNGRVQHNGSGLVQQADGVMSFSSLASVSAGSRITNFSAFHAVAPNIATGNWIENHYGLNVGTTAESGFTQTGTIGTSTGVRIGRLPTATSTTYGILQESPADKSVFYGNIGLGTTTPSGRLAITATSTGTRALVIANSSDVEQFAFEDDGDLRFGTGAILDSASVNDVNVNGHLSAAFGVWTRATGGSRTNGFDAATTGNLAFKVNGANNIVNMLSTGNVGVGTTSPFGKLTIGTHDQATTIPSLLVASSSGSGATTTVFQVLNNSIVLGASTTQNSADRIQAVSDDSSALGIGLFLANSSATAAPRLFTQKSRGTRAAPTAVQQNDVISQWIAQGFATSFANSGNIRMVVDQAITGSTVPTAISFLVSATSSAAAEGLRLSSGRDLIVGNATVTDSPAQLYIDTEARTFSEDVFQVGTGSDTTQSDFIIKQTTGRVGVATTSPWRQFSVVGTMSVNGLTLNTGAAAASVCLSSSNEITRNTDNETCLASSIRYKENVQALRGGLAKILDLKPVTFDYKDGSGKDKIGLIAEDVARVDEHLVSVDDGGIPNGIRWSHVTTMLIQGVQDIVARLTGLEEKLNEQQRTIEALDARLKALEAKE